MLNVLSVWTVRDENTVDSRQDPTKTVKMLSGSGSILATGQLMNDTNESLNENPFFVTAHMNGDERRATTYLASTKSVTNRMQRSAPTR